MLWYLLEVCTVTFSKPRNVCMKASIRHAEQRNTVAATGRGVPIVIPLCYPLFEQNTSLRSVANAMSSVMTKVLRGMCLRAEPQ